MINMSAKSTGEVVETAMVGRDSVMIKGDRPCIALALQAPFPRPQTVLI